MAYFPSLRTLAQESTQTFLRFPMVLLSAVAGTIVSINLSYLKYNDHAEQEINACMLMVCALGLTLFFSLTLFSERRNHSKKQAAIIQTLGLLALAGYYFFLRNYFVQVEFVRYALINLALHLFASFSAFLQKDHLTGFWQFNKSLFLRLFFGGVYSATLFLGIALALAAVDQLFNVDIRGESYFRLWIIVVGVFNTWFFLAGVPKNLTELDAKEEYPKGLKIFTQYVLLPLVTLYLLILYAYMGKILIVQSLPKGWVSNLVIGFSVVGILALLLIHPIRNVAGNNWIHIFSKWFYGALYPLIIMLFIAIGRRISDYGITENRYFIIVLAVWLAVIATYFLFSKDQNIKLIPLSLCLIALLCACGPWSAFSVSERSQFKRIEKILAENKVLVNGKVDVKHPEVSDSVAARVHSILRYFDAMHDFEKFKPWFTQNIDTLVADSLRWSRIQNILKAMHIQEVNNYNYGRDEEEGYYSQYFSYYPDYQENGKVKDISGFDYEMMFNASSYDHSNYANKYALQKDTFAFTVSGDSTHMELKLNKRLLYNLDLENFIKTMNDSCHKQNISTSSIPSRLMERTFEDSTLKIKLQFTGLYGYVKNKKYKTNSASGNCLVKIKTPPAQ